MRKSFYILGILVLGVIVLCLTYPDKHKRQALHGKVGLTFLSYTNDPSGTRIGRFEVTNPSPVEITLESLHEIQLAATNGWTSQGFRQAELVMVPPKQSAVLEIVAPSIKTRWRIGMNYTYHTGLAADALLLLKRFGPRLSVNTAVSNPVEP
jgi:hypothetical protein